MDVIDDTYKVSVGGVEEPKPFPYWILLGIPIIYLAVKN